MPYHGPRRRSKRNFFGKRVSRSGKALVNKLTRVGLIENRMVPIFPGIPLNDLDKIGEDINIAGAIPAGEIGPTKNPWAKIKPRKLYASEQGNILTSRSHLGIDDVFVRCKPVGSTIATTPYRIEKALRIGLLPRSPLGPLRLGGVEGKYIYMKNLQLSFNFRYNGPEVSMAPGVSIPALAKPYKVSIMLVQQRPGDVGEKYKQSIEQKSWSGNQQISQQNPTSKIQDPGGGAQNTVRCLAGASDFLGDNLLMDPLGQPFGVGKRQWHFKVNTPAEGGGETMPVDPTSGNWIPYTDQSINGDRNGEFYFKCPVQKKWFTVVRTSTFVLGPPNQPLFTAATSANPPFGGKIAYPTSKTVTMNLPLNCRCLMKSLGITRNFPEGMKEENELEAQPANTDPEASVIKKRKVAHALQESIYQKDQSSVYQKDLIEWLAPADVDLSQYHIVVKAYSFTEDFEDNVKRNLSTDPTGVLQEGSNAPMAEISYKMTGMMTYNDV